MYDLSFVVAFTICIEVHITSSIFYRISESFKVYFERVKCT